MDGENNGKPYKNGWFGGTTILGNIHNMENVPFFKCFEVVNKLNSAQVESLSAAAPLVAAGEQLLVPTVPQPQRATNGGRWNNRWHMPWNAIRKALVTGRKKNENVKKQWSLVDVHFPFSFDFGV